MRRVSFVATLAYELTSGSNASAPPSSRVMLAPTAAHCFRHPSDPHPHAFPCPFVYLAGEYYVDRAAKVLHFLPPSPDAWSWLATHNSPYDTGQQLHPTTGQPHELGLADRFVFPTLEPAPSVLDPSKEAFVSMGDSVIRIVSVWHPRIRLACTCERILSPEAWSLLLPLCVIALRTVGGCRRHPDP
jgi:hypothetical protein